MRLRRERAEKKRKYLKLSENKRDADAIISIVNNQSKVGIGNRIVNHERPI
jgi:hypothetical protein